MDGGWVCMGCNIEASGRKTLGALQNVDECRMIDVDYVVVQIPFGNG